MENKSAESDKIDDDKMWDYKSLQKKKKVSNLKLSNYVNKSVSVKKTLSSGNIAQDKPSKLAKVGLGLGPGLRKVKHSSKSKERIQVKEKLHLRLDFKAKSSSLEIPKTNQTLLTPLKGSRTKAHCVITSTPDQSSNAKKIDETGYLANNCPYCQMPLSALLESPTWHVTECMSFPIVSKEECTAGLECDNTIVSHYRKYRHTALANQRAHESNWTENENSKSKAEPYLADNREKSLSPPPAKLKIKMFDFGSKSKKPATVTVLDSNSSDDSDQCDVAPAEQLSEYFSDDATEGDAILENRPGRSFPPEYPVCTDIKTLSIPVKRKLDVNFIIKTENIKLESGNEDDQFCNKPDEGTDSVGNIASIKREVDSTVVINNRVLGTVKMIDSAAGRSIVKTEPQSVSSGLVKIEKFDSPEFCLCQEKKCLTSRQVPCDQSFYGTDADFCDRNSHPSIKLELVDDQEDRTRSDQIEHDDPPGLLSESTLHETRSMKTEKADSSGFCAAETSLELQAQHEDSSGFSSDENPAKQCTSLRQPVPDANCDGNDQFALTEPVNSGGGCVSEMTVPSQPGMYGDIIEILDESFSDTEDLVPCGANNIIPHSVSSEIKTATSKSPNRKTLSTGKKIQHRSQDTNFDNIKAINTAVKLQNSVNQTSIHSYFAMTHVNKKSAVKKSNNTSSGTTSADTSQQRNMTSTPATVTSTAAAPKRWPISSGGKAAKTKKQVDSRGQPKPTTGKPVRSCPFYKKIPGTSFTVDAFSYGSIPDCRAYFLSHFHYDHYGGLKKKFSHDLYCSKVTANLVLMKIKVENSFVHALPMNTAIVIEGVEVTLLEANHCPGSVLFLFRHPDGSTYLHTGDFRADPQMELYPQLRDISVTQLFLDTTYCDPTYAFPPQREAMAFAVTKATEFIQSNPKILIVVGTYTIGKERIFTAIATALSCKICVQRDKKNILDCLEDVELSKRLTLNPMDAQLHVLPMRSLSFVALKEYLEKFQSQFDSLLAFEPTGWTHARNKTPSLDTIKPKINKNGITLYGVPYSEHSSYTEMKRFVQFVKPEKIIPTVNNGNPRSRKQMEEIFRSWMLDFSPKKSLHQSGLNQWLDH